MRSREFPTLTALKESRLPDNGTALALLVVVPLPSSPAVLLPQQYPIPPVVTPHETELPALMVENTKVFVPVIVSPPPPPQPVSARPINNVLTQFVTVTSILSLRFMGPQSYNRGRVPTRAMRQIRFLTASRIWKAQSFQSASMSWKVRSFQSASMSWKV